MFLGYWKHAFSETADLALQLYYDRTEFDDLVITETRDTYDLDFQHRFGLGRRQEMVWGLGYRFTHDRAASTFTFSLDPDRRGSHLFSAFLQDDIALVA